MSRFADIVLPLAQPTYCFSVPEGAEGEGVRVGDAVAVQFGPRNIYTGIVWRLHDERPNAKRIKSIGRRLYDRPLLDEKQMRLWEWMADYYMCTLGEVMRMALPSLIKPQGTSAEEFSQEMFHPRTEAYVALAEAWQDGEAAVPHAVWSFWSRLQPSTRRNSMPRARFPAACWSVTLRSYRLCARRDMLLSISAREQSSATKISHL